MNVVSWDQKAKSRANEKHWHMSIYRLLFDAFSKLEMQLQQQIRHVLTSLHTYVFILLFFNIINILTKIYLQRDISHQMMSEIFDDLYICWWFLTFWRISDIVGCWGWEVFCSTLPIYHFIGNVFSFFILFFLFNDFL